MSARRRLANHTTLIVIVAALFDTALADPPDPPSGIRHTACSPAHLRVEWTDNSQDELGFRVWRSEVGTDRWYLAGKTSANATHFDDGGMQEQTAYEHRVAAFNEDGASPPASTEGPTRTRLMTSHLSPQVVVSSNGRTFPRAPTMLALKDGRLLLVYGTGRLEHRRRFWNGSIVKRFSSDAGATWSSPQVVALGDRLTAFGKPALVRMASGQIGLSYSQFGLDSEGRIARRTRLFVRSTDEGITWCPPVNMGAASSNNDTLIVGHNGRLLQALTSYEPASQIVASDDEGLSWSTIATVAVRREALPTGEAALVHCGLGHLVFLSRHEAPFYCLNHSHDNGRTWEQAQTLFLGGGDNPPKVTRLPVSDTLVAVVHSWYSGKKAKDRRQLASMISNDCGRTWDNFRLIGYSTDGKDGFLQHSVCFIGDRAFVFYGGGSNRDAADGDDLRLIRLESSFFTSSTSWPYDWRGQPL